MDSNQEKLYTAFKPISPQYHTGITDRIVCNFFLTFYWPLSYSSLHKNGDHYSHATEIFVPELGNQYFCQNVRAGDGVNPTKYLLHNISW